jgi:hypothetical protein
MGVVNIGVFIKYDHSNTDNLKNEKKRKAMHSLSILVSS